MRDLKQDLALCKQATPGPWRLAVLDDASIFAGDTRLTRFLGENGEENARFAVEARQGWPHAIKRAIRAEEEVDHLKRLLQHEDSRIEELIKMVALLVQKCGGEVELLEKDLRLMITDVLSYVTVHHTPDGKVILTTHISKEKDS